MAVNHKRYAQSLIKNALYPLAIKIRDSSVEDLKKELSEAYEDFDYNLNGLNKTKFPDGYDPGGVVELELNGQNKPFIKFFLSRLTAYIENESGDKTSFVNYMDTTQSKPFQIEHLWCDDYEQFKDEFDQRDRWGNYRNCIGALILLPQGTNQSHNKDPYTTKLPHYLKENLLAQSLHPTCYEKNPNFTKWFERVNLPFKAHEKMKKADVDDRLGLYSEISKKIWNKELFN